jgi:hypothetical protein
VASFGRTGNGAPPRFENAKTASARRDWEDNVSIRREFADRATTTAQVAASTLLAIAVAAAVFRVVSDWNRPTRAPESGLDIIALQGKVLAAAGRSGIDVNDLGGGIVELVGEARSAGEAAALIETVRGASGVDVVLDRLWVRTPRLVS